jgi:branched-chain amino acid transport system substrate-binding protein
MVVGASLSLSGDFAVPGESAKQAYDLWAKQVNSAGGLLGRDVRLEILDDGSDPQQVVTNYEQLMNADDADLLLGPFSTFLTAPSAVVAQRNGYALVTGMGGGPEVHDQGLDNVFNVVIAHSLLMKSFADAMLSQEDAPSTAAYVTLDDPFTTSQVNFAREQLEAGGVETVADELYPPTTKNFRPIAAKVASSDADIVVAGSGFPDLVAFVETFSQQDYQPKALISAGGADEIEAFKEALGSSTEGVMIPGFWTPTIDTEANQEFVDAYIEEFGGEPHEISVTTAQAYTAADVLGQAVEAAGSVDQQAIIDAVNANTFESIIGPVDVNETGENEAIDALQLQWQGEGLKAVLPPELAEAEFLYPKPEW